MPKFSIIIPVYNAAPYLRESLDSVLAQTFTDWEAICVDDGSTDGSGVILDEYAAKDNRIRVVHQENKGVNFARQRALDISQGDWIASIDGDDWVGPDYLKHFYQVVAEGNCDFIWSDYYIVNNGEVKYTKQSSCSADAPSFQVALLNGCLWGANWNKIYSRRFILGHNISFPSEERVFICEDLCFNMQVLYYLPIMKYVQAADYYYRVRNGSAVRSCFSQDRLLSGIYVNNELIRYAVNKETKDLIDLRRKELKVQAYSSEQIDDAMFCGLYPEILSLEGYAIPFWHRVLFWLSVRGFRAQVLCCLKIIRKVRGL